MPVWGVNFIELRRICAVLYSRQHQLFRFAWKAGIVVFHHLQNLEIEGLRLGSPQPLMLVPTNFLFFVRLSYLIKSKLKITILKYIF
jgi:hypothetical protein